MSARGLRTEWRRIFAPSRSRRQRSPRCLAGRRAIDSRPMRNARVGSSRKNRTARPPARRPTSRPRARRMPRVAMIALVSVGLGIVLWRPIARIVVARRPPAHPAERMGADQLFDTGLRFGNAGLHLAGLPYFRRLVDLLPSSWEARQNYANTLYNGAQEPRVHLGRLEPATRSSLERIQMIAESLRQTDAASSLATEPTDRALIEYQRAQALYTFGFALDALVGF